MKIDGACHCGLITYEAEIDPEQVEVCHCTDCQSLSASAFRVVVPAPADKFSLSGEPTVYVKTAESGARRIQTFCPDADRRFTQQPRIRRPRRITSESEQFGSATNSRRNFSTGLDLPSHGSRISRRYHELESSRAVVATVTFYTAALSSHRHGTTAKSGPHLIRQ